MSPKETTDHEAPSWKDVRKEASALSREVAEQGLVWSRRAFRLASRVAWTAAQEVEKTSKRAGSTVNKIRRQ